MEPEARDRAGFKGVDMLDEEEWNGWTGARMEGLMVVGMAEPEEGGSMGADSDVRPAVKTSGIAVDWG